MKFGQIECADSVNDVFKSVVFPYLTELAVLVLETISFDPLLERLEVVLSPFVSVLSLVFEARENILVNGKNLTDVRSLRPIDCMIVLFYERSSLA